MSASKLTTVVTLPISRRANRYALAVSVPLALAMVALKIVKLPTARSEGVFAADLTATAWAQLVDALRSSDLLVVLTIVAGAVVVIARAVPGGLRVRAAIVAALLGTTLLSLGLADGMVVPPPSLDWLRKSVSDAVTLAALFWREALVFLALLVLLGWHAGAAAVRPSRLRSTLVWLGLVLATFVLAVDGAYFAAARAEISTDELLYTLASPFDTLTAARDGLARDTGLMISMPLGALAVAALLAYFVGRRPAAETATPVRQGAYAWPLALLVLLGTVGTLGQRAERLSGNPLLRIGGDLLSMTWYAASQRADAAQPSSTRVPNLDRRATTLHAGSGTRRYNVVLILLESMRADATSVYAPSLPTTPFLAQLAADALVVDSLYANVPRTSAAWIATVAGRYPGTVAMHRQWWSRDDAAALESSLAIQLGRLGYSTAFFVPTRLDFENDVQVVRDLGFEHVVSAENLSRSSYRALNSFGKEDRALLPDLRAWLDARVATASPFFLTIMTNVGHFPYRVPNGTPKRLYAGVSEQKSDYYNAVGYADGFVRDVYGELESRGLLDDTLLLVLGDHGEAFGEHGLVWHTAVVYEEALRIPGIVRLPRAMHRTGRIRGLRQQIDVLPTVAEVLGLELRGGRAPGRSLLDDAGHPVLFFATHFDNGALALRDGDLKYIYRFGRRPTEVYRLSSDPAEERNVAGVVPTREIAAAERDLRAWLGAVRSTYREAR